MGYVILIELTVSRIFSLIRCFRLCPQNYAILSLLSLCCISFFVNQSCVISFITEYFILDKLKIDSFCSFILTIIFHKFLLISVVKVLHNLNNNYVDYLHNNQFHFCIYSHMENITISFKNI